MGFTGNFSLTLSICIFQWPERVIFYISLVKMNPLEYTFYLVNSVYDHSKIDKTIGSLMKVESITEHSP